MTMVWYSMKIYEDIWSHEDTQVSRLLATVRYGLPPRWPCLGLCAVTVAWMSLLMCTGEHANTELQWRFMTLPRWAAWNSRKSYLVKSDTAICKRRIWHILTRNARQCSHDLKHPVPQHPGFNQGLVDEIRIDHLCDDETLRGLKDFSRFRNCGKRNNKPIIFFHS